MTRPCAYHIAIAGLALSYSAFAAAGAPTGAVAVRNTSDILASRLSDESNHTDDSAPVLKKLMALHEGDGLGGSRSRKGLSGMRAKAMRQEAQTIGSQMALRYRNQQIQKIISTYSSQLDQAFDFGPLMIEDVVVPPVIERIEHSTRKYDDNTMRSVQVGYRYTHQARIVTTPPTWRSFLIRRYASPETPPNVLLPKNSTEQSIWRKAIRQGWNQGVDQANDDFKVSLNLLTSTYLGMLQYKVLLAEHVVSAPNLATTNLRITSHGRSVDVGDRIYRLTKQSRFRDPSEWQAVPTPPEGQ